jgi:type II secretory pathway pseudopilin PulG
MKPSGPWAQRASTHLARQRGWSLLESLLGLALMASVLAGVLTLQTRLADRRQGQLEADEVSSFTQLMAQYFIAHRLAMEAQMAGGTSNASSTASNPCQINVTPSAVAGGGTGIVTGAGQGVPSSDPLKHTCAVDTSLLLALGLWPSGMPTERGGRRLVAIFRQVYWAGQATGADEVLVLYAATQDGKILSQGASVFQGREASFLELIEASQSLLGGTGGYVPPGHDVGACQYNDQIKQACGQAWAVSLADFL